MTCHYISPDLVKCLEPATHQVTFMLVDNSDRKVVPGEPVSDPVEVQGVPYCGVHCPVEGERPWKNKQTVYTRVRPVG